MITACYESLNGKGQEYMVLTYKSSGLSGDQVGWMSPG